MLGFKLKLNGKTTQAALSDGVVSLIFTRLKLNERDEKYFSLTGTDFNKNEHLEWLKMNLEVGDKIEVEICNVDEASKPSNVKTMDPDDVVLQGKLKAYNSLKEELKNKGLI